MPQDFLSKDFIKYRESLLSYSRKFNVSYEVREELVSDTIFIANNSFVHDRASFESYCRVILKNKIINFKNRNKDLFVLISLDDYEEILPAHNESIEAKENVKSVAKFFEKLKGELKPDELTLFNEIYNTCDNLNKINISKASKNIEIAADIGWNTFKKIQRKASKLYKKLKEDNVELSFTLEPPLDNLVMEDGFFDKPLNLPSFQKADSFNQVGFEYFLSKLSTDQINKINLIYGYTPPADPPVEKPPGFFKKLFSRNTK